MIEVRAYVDASGRCPFARWLDGLRAPAHAKVQTAVARMVEQDDVVMAELRGTARRTAGGEMRMSMAEVFVMRDGKIAERRAWVTVLEENDFR